MFLFTTRTQEGCSIENITPLLPIHPRPFPDELLSSWLVRLALSNGFNVHSFYSSLLRYKNPLWNRDLDRGIELELSRILSQRTGVSAEQIESLALASYSGFLFSKLRIHGSSRWINPVGIYHRQHTRFGLQCCPMCLKADPTPYFRRHWRLALVAICTKHKCLLHDRCSECGSPIAFHRNAIGELANFPSGLFAHCFNCGKALAEMPQQSCVGIPKPFYQAYFRMLSRFEKLRYHIRSQTLPVAISYFDGLSILVATIGSTRGASIRSAFMDEFNIELSQFIPLARLEFGYLSPHQRVGLLAAACWLTECWPSHFLQLLKHKTINRSSFVDHYADMPFWLAAFLDEECNHHATTHTDEELFQCVSTLNKAGVPVCTTNICKHIGLSRDVARKAVRIFNNRYQEFK